ncbi:MAG: UMP kinase [Candidatus Saccharibacteria bacterium]
MDTQPYTRVLLKLSGEQLAGKFESGIDAEFSAWLANEVKKVIDSGTQVVIMVGGGNYARGVQLVGHGIQRVTADNIGMLATMMNGLALSDIFNNAGVSARVVSTIKADQIADQFTHRRSESHLKKGRVVIVAGGIGRPYLTTDTAAVSLALELDCQVVLKATKVDGVYDKDPTQFPEATKIDYMTFQQAVVDDNIKVMDKAAMGLALEHNLPIIVFNANITNNIRQAVLKQAIGTTIGAS